MTLEEAKNNIGKQVVPIDCGRADRDSEYGIIEPTTAMSDGLVTVLYGTMEEGCIVYFDPEQLELVEKTKPTCIIDFVCNCEPNCAYIEDTNQFDVPRCNYTYRHVLSGMWMCNNSQAKKMAVVHYLNEMER